MADTLHPITDNPATAETTKTPPKMSRFKIVFAFLCCCLASFAQQGSVEQLAIEFLKNGETEKSLKLFDEAYSKSPSAHLYKLYLDVLLQEKQIKDAERLVRKHLKNFPQTLATSVDLGYIYLISGDKTKADKTFLDVLKNLPNSETQLADIAGSFFVRTQTEYAIQAFLQGRLILNDPHAFAIDLASLYEQTGRISEMTQEYLVLLEFDPNILPYIQQKMQAIFANDSDKKAAAESRKTILDYIQKNPQSRSAQNFWIGLLLSTQDFDLAFTFAKSYDRRFGDGGQKAMEVAQVAQNSRSKVAEQAYRYLISKGSTSPLYFSGRVGLLSYYYQKITTAVAVDSSALFALEEQYEELLNSSPLSPQSIGLIRDWARILAFYKGDFKKADSLLQKPLNTPNFPRNLIAECKLDLADIYLFTGEVWESTLLYSQVEKEFKHDEIGFDAKLRNARLSYYIGEFEWSLAQLDVLRAATSKLIANDAMELSLLIRENNDVDSSYTNLTLFAHADLLVYQRNYEEALRVYDSIRKRQFQHALYDDILMRRADIALKKENLQEAQQYLEEIYTAYSEDLLADDALFLSARIYEEKMNLPFKALELYEKILLEYPSSLYLPFVRLRFRELRENQQTLEFNDDKIF